MSYLYGQYTPPPVSYPAPFTGWAPASQPAKTDPLSGEVAKALRETLKAVPAGTSSLSDQAALVEKLTNAYIQLRNQGE